MNINKSESLFGVVREPFEGQKRDQHSALANLIFGFIHIIF